MRAGAHASPSMGVRWGWAWAGACVLGSGAIPARARSVAPLTLYLACRARIISISRIMCEASAIAAMGLRAWQDIVLCHEAHKYTGCEDVEGAYEAMLNWRKTGKSFTGLSRKVRGAEARLSSSEGNKVKKAMKRRCPELEGVEERFFRKKRSMTAVDGK